MESRAAYWVVESSQVSASELVLRHLFGIQRSLPGKAVIST